MHKFKISVLSLVLLIVALSSMAQQQKRPKDMIFSYVEHPTMINYLIPLIRSSYKKLGVETHFVPQPSNRNLHLIEEGKIDGDVGYMRIVLKGYNNLITVEPPVVLGIFTLLCQPEVPCNKKVLANRKLTLVSTSASQTGLENSYKGELKAQFYTVNNISIIPEFIKLKRFQYAIYPTSEKDLWRLNSSDFQFVKLLDSNLYHVLHEKYQFMADDVELAIQKTMEEMIVK